MIAFLSGSAFNAWRPIDLHARGPCQSPRSTDLEEFEYELDIAGNITTTTELDGTVWEHEYDDR